jgi:hypothetical protein
MLAPDTVMKLLEQEREMLFGIGARGKERPIVGKRVRG